MKKQHFKVGDRVKCVKEFRSVVFPQANYGVIDAEYTVTHTYDTGGTCKQPRYIGTDPPLGDLPQGEWVNSARFKKSGRYQNILKNGD